MSIIQGPSSSSYEPSVTTENTTESTATQQAQLDTSGSPAPIVSPASLSSTALFNLTFLDSKTVSQQQSLLKEPLIEEQFAAANKATEHAKTAQVSARLHQAADSEFFTRLETSVQSDLDKANGKMTRSDLKAAIQRGGLSPEERAIAEYLLANFSIIAPGRSMRAEDLQAHAAGIALAGANTLPLTGLKSFMDDKDAGSFFGLFRHDQDFRNLANGTTISEAELERGLNDDSFSETQKQAIQFLLDNFAAVGGQDGKITERELATIVRSIEHGQLSQDVSPHRQHLEDIIFDDDLFQALNDNATMQGTITEAELAQAQTNPKFSANQQAAITFLLDNFDRLAKGDDSLNRSDLYSLAMHNVNTLSQTLRTAQQRYADAVNARSQAFEDRATLEAFVTKVDELFQGDDRAQKVGFFTYRTEKPGEERFDNRTTFSEPRASQDDDDGGDELSTDGYVSRNDLAKALESDTLSADEKNIALILLNHFSQIGDNKSTINTDQIATFLSTFSPAMAQSQANHGPIQTVNTLQITRI